MHMALTHLNTVVLYDQTSSGRSAYHLPRGLPCPSVSTDADDSKESGCWAHSMDYDVATNTIRPLSIRTDTWCSSGSFLSDGTLEQTGGYKQGARRIRYFRPCADRNCVWNESSSTFLAEGRWYATNQGGNNLYPFVHLSSDGNLFIFANRDSILFDYRRGTVLRTFPRLPGDGSRNYPSTGSSVMLPLEHSDNFQRVEVMVCGVPPPVPSRQPLTATSTKA
ncbi:hypothetical protein HPP92_009753 [Vanilla planifolia]|uniref:Glyoxal oxidase N-terminal domain-containing protein n=1 Tax=Vanilla planifolia TaxID=51239 RepID=A0A835V7Q7_VANPL|nr:hypothetical protein HPP92_009950 [Vanilla planifolia]KAG0487658.1 hypothetical protein HPP92_009753 [Vanilla planifolia]